MKVDSKSEDYYLRLCRRMLEEKFGWGSSSGWSHADFLEASERISESTGISLSVTTIKRVWGKIKYAGFPSNSTLNALAIYLGYENWRTFKVSRDEIENDEPELAVSPAIEPPPIEPSPIEPSTKEHNIKKPSAKGSCASEYSNREIGRDKRFSFKKGSQKKRVYLLFSLVLMLCISIFFMVPRQEKRLSSAAMEQKVLFNSEPVTIGLPNTVVFNYDISVLDFDSAFIQQNWDPQRRQRIKKEDTQLTSVYYYPGHFNAKLIVNDKIIKEHGLLIPTKGWLGILSRKEESVPVYIQEQDLIRQGVMQASAKVLEENTMDGRKDYQLSYSYAKSFEVDGDNFTVEAAVKNSSKAGALICQESYLLLDGEKGIIWFPLSIPGCVGNLNLQVSEVVVKGKTTDLSLLGTDLNNWNHIKCTVENREVKLFLNNELVFSTVYKVPIGKIMGINFGFQGAGEVDFVRLMDKNGKIAFEDDFLGKD